MNKLFVIACASLISGMALADLDVNFQNNTVTVVDSDENYVSGTVSVQLLWSASSPLYLAGENGSVGAGEYLLASVTSQLYDDGIFDDTIPGAGLGQFLDSDVGGADVNSGYIYARFYDDTAKAEGDWYLQFTLAGPTLAEYDTAPDPRPAPYLAADLLPSAGSAGPVGNSYELDDATYGHQVIPEPAVASLIAIFGGGLLVSRRIFSKG